MQDRDHELESRTVLVVSTASEHDSVHQSLVGRALSRCVALEREEALSTLRSDPFTVQAVVLTGDGESPVTNSVLRAIKHTAPRIPIVFLDEQESMTSEVQVRRTGVHYYSHLPVNSEEIASVLAALGGSSESGKEE